MAKKLEDVFKSKMSKMPKDAPEPKASSSGAGRLQAAAAAAQDNDDSDEHDSSDWNKRLLQVQEQMRQLNQQIQIE